MLTSEFDAAMARLRACYGPQAFTEPDELREVAVAARPLAAKDFDAIVTSIVVAYPKRPPAAAVIGACHARRKELADRAKATANARLTAAKDGFCRWCANSGMCTALERAAPHFERVFRCDACDSADQRQLSRSIPAWREELGERFVRAPTPIEARALLAEGAP